MKAVVLYDPPPPPPPLNDVVNTRPLGGKQYRQPQLNDHKHNKLVVTVYTGITIQTLVLYYVVKCAGFTHAHRCIHKHTQILHSADRTCQLPTLKGVSSLNTISCQLCAEQTRVTTRVHEAVLPSLSLTLIQLLSTMHLGFSSYTIPPVQLMSVYHLLLIQGHPLRPVRQGPEQGMGALTGCKCDSHCERQSPHPGMWEGEWGSKGNLLM